MSVKYRFIDSSDPEVVVDQVCDLSAMKESALFLSLLLLNVDGPPFSEARILDNFLQRRGGPRIKRFEVRILLSKKMIAMSSDRRLIHGISTSSVHGIASARWFEPEHTSVLKFVSN